VVGVIWGVLGRTCGHGEGADNYILISNSGNGKTKRERQKSLGERPSTKKGGGVGHVVRWREVDPLRKRPKKAI